MEPKNKPPCPENIPANDQNKPSVHSEKPELPPKVMKLLEDPRSIISMCACRNCVIFKFENKTSIELRCKFCDLLQYLPCNIFLQVHRSWVINMYCMNEEWHCQTCGWIILTDNQKYYVSESYMCGYFGQIRLHRGRQICKKCFGKLCVWIFRPN